MYVNKTRDTPFFSSVHRDRSHRERRHLHHHHFHHGHGREELQGQGLIHWVLKPKQVSWHEIWIFYCGWKRRPWNVSSCWFSKYSSSSSFLYPIDRETQHVRRIRTRIRIFDGQKYSILKKGEIVFKAIIYSRAPTDCVQYLTGASGNFMSFNQQGGNQLRNQNYNVCIRQEEGDDDPWHFHGIVSCNSRFLLQASAAMTSAAAPPPIPGPSSCCLSQTRTLSKLEWVRSKARCTIDLV